MGVYRRFDAVQGEVGERAVSRVLFTDKSRCAVIPLGCPLPDDSNGLPGHSPGEPGTERTAPLPLFGLSPGGVYPARDVTAPAVSSYLTISPLPGIRGSPAVYFLWHFPWDRSRWTLATTLPCGARTFLVMVGPCRDRYTRSPSDRIPKLPQYWKS